MSVNLEAVRQVELNEAVSAVAQFEGGSIAYSMIGQPTGHHNRIVTVKGFSRGRMAWLEMAKDLSVLDGGREVIISDQAKFTAKMPTINDQAEALLAVLEDSGSSHMPIDFVAHSFGAVILAKAAELAADKKLDMTPFDSAKGSSHSVFLAPGGTVEDENPISVALRFGQHKRQSKHIGRLETDVLRAEINEDRHGQPLKTLAEGLALGREKINYKHLLELGMYPEVFIYPEDLVFSFDKTRKVLNSNLDSLDGVLMAVGAPHGTHSDPIFDPEPSAEAVLQVLDLHEGPRHV